MSKIGKSHIMHSLQGKGFDRSEASELYDALVDSISDYLCEGNEVNLKGIGKITSTKVPAHIKQFLGNEIEVEENIKINFSASRLLKRKYKLSHSTTAKQGAHLKDISKLFSK